MNKETKNATNHWDIVTRLFHWLSAVWILGLIGVGLVMVNLAMASGQKFELYQLHKSYGFLFGFVLIARIVWKFLSQRPKHLGSGLLHKAAVANQYLMLCLLLWLIISGYALVSFSIIPIPINLLGWPVPSLLTPDMMREKTATAIHHYIAFTFIALVFIHSLAALFNHFILKDETLTRMIKNKP